jgi:hypothetical protein
MCLLGGPARATSMNLVTDGTFVATKVSSPGGFLCANTGGSTCNSNLTDWNATCSSGGCTGTASPSSILFAGTNGSAWNGGYGLTWSGIGNAPTGGNVVAIDGGTSYDSTLSQTINGLVVGHVYLLQFYQAATQQIGETGATTEQWQVTLGGTTQTSALQNTPSQGAHPWEIVNLDFVATSTSELLSFFALGSPSNEPPVSLLADVSLQDIPEPASLALVGCGVLALGLVSRRRA